MIIIPTRKILGIPTTQVTSIVFSEVFDTQLKVSITRGDGIGYILVARLSASASVLPVSNTTYTANSVFTSGSDLGSGNYVLYKGILSDSILITGLTPNTSYVFTAYEYNMATVGTEKYNVSTATGNPSSQTTLQNIVAPTTQATTLSFSGDRQLNFTSGNGARRIVVVKQGSAVNSNPVDNTTYTANKVFGSGTQLGTGNYVVYDGTASKCYIEGLSYNTTYHFRVFEYNISNGNPLYFTSTASGNPFNTTTATQELWVLNHQPVAQPIRDINHPETVSRVVSKTFPGMTLETPTELLQFIVADNNENSIGVPWHLDQTFLRYKSKSDGLNINEGWQWYISGAGTEPTPVLASGDTWNGGTTAQNHITSVYRESDGTLKAYGVVNLNVISARYSLCKFTSTDNGRTWTRKTTPVIQESQTRSFYYPRHYVDTDLNKIFIIVINSKTIKYEVWSSTDALVGDTFTLVCSDLLGQNSEISPSIALYEGWPGVGIIRKSAGTYTFTANTTHVPAYSATATTHIYSSLQTQIIQCSTTDLTVATPSLVVDKVLYTTDQQEIAGVYPSSDKITFNSADHYFLGAYLWKTEDAVGTLSQVSIDTRVLSSTAVVNTGMFQSGVNVYPANAKHYKMHQTHLDDTHGGTVQPYEVYGAETLTVSGTPVQNYLNTVTQNTSSYIQGATFTHSQTNFAVMTMIDGTGQLSPNNIDRGICSKQGTFELVFDNSLRLEVRFYGASGGTKIYRSVNSVQTEKTGIFGPAHNAVGATINLNVGGTDMDVKLFVDYTEVTMTMVQNDTFTSIAQNTNPIKFGVVPTLPNFNTFMGDTFIRWGLGYSTIDEMKKLQ